MRIGIIVLTFAYVLSQFYRAFLAVLAQDLGADLGATPADLSRASGYWFLAFAAMQIPVGAALDRIGPRRTASALLMVGALGAFWFAGAGSVRDIEIAMILIGIGCSAVLMASYYIFARVYSAAVFATLAGAIIGVGSIGNLASALPMTLAVEALGWRTAMVVLAGVTALTAAAIFWVVQDPEKVEGGSKGSVLDLLKMPAMWLILPMMLVAYAPSAGLRGLWAGPYMTEVFTASAATVGTVTLVMGLAMIAGNFAYGPLDRVFGTRKWVVFTGNVLGGICCLVLWAMPANGVVFAAVLLAAIGLFGSSFPMIVAHARAFFPPHLVGRGVTLVNLFGIGGVGVMQMVTGPVHSGVQQAGGTVTEAYQMLFALFGITILLGCALYAFSEDRTS